MRKKAINIKKILTAGALALVGFFIVFLNATSTVFAADFIIQDDPFVFQATAGNNESIFYELENQAEILEKRGYSIVYNQLNDPDNFESQISLNYNNFYLYYSELTNNSYELVYEISTFEFYNENDILIDLTLWFGENYNIPVDILENSDNFIKYYQGEFNFSAGTIINSNAQYLYAIGRNQWDEEWEVGGINSSGQFIPDTAIRSKNYIPVISNSNYYFHFTNYTAFVFFYDNNFNFISANPQITVAGNRVFKTPSNCSYIAFQMSDLYGTTYNNDITISLYYEGKSGYDNYYPYEVLSEVDTGSEELLAFDVKYPDGMIERGTASGNITNLVYLRTTEQGLNLYRTDFNAKANSYDFISNLGLEVVTSFNSETETEEKVQYSSEALAFYVLLKPNRSGDDFNFMYPLATPTTEQGTPFGENITIDELGSMFWGGTDYNLIPQGNKILYQISSNPPPPAEDPDRNDFNTGIIVILIIIILIAIVTNIESRGR